MVRVNNNTVVPTTSLACMVSRINSTRTNTPHRQPILEPTVNRHKAYARPRMVAQVQLNLRKRSKLPVMLLSAAVSLTHSDEAILGLDSSRPAPKIQQRR